jgi:hypothetical protein
MRPRNVVRKHPFINILCFGLVSRISILADYTFSSFKASIYHPLQTQYFWFFLLRNLLFYDNVLKLSYLLPSAVGGNLATNNLARTVITALILQTLVLAGSCWSSKNACAGTPDKAGNNAEIFSISITPNSVPAGTYPEISGFVRNTSSSKNGKNGKAVFDVMAVITAPNKSPKSLVWHNVSFSSGQKKFYAFVNNYDNNQVGTYQIVYSVYNSGRTHRYASLSKSFTVTNLMITSKQVPSSGKTNKAPQETKTDRPRTPAQQGITIERKKPTPYKRPAEADRRSDQNVFGIGASVNTLNLSGGPSLIFWPSQNLAIQGSYGMGTFTSYEVRTFYRFPLSQHLKPYIGAGYLHAERQANVIGVDTTITGDSITGFIGVELPVSKNLYAYIDVSGTPMKLQKEVTNGGTQATATVTYSAVTINLGIMLYLF